MQPSTRCRLRRSALRDPHHGCVNSTQPNPHTDELHGGHNRITHQNLRLGQSPVDEDGCPEEEEVSLLSSCFFTRRLKSRFYLVVQSERITIIEASEGHGPPERNLHETTGPKIDEDNLSRGEERGASASCRQDTRSPTDPTPVPSPQPSQQHTPEPPLQPSTRATPSLLGKRRRDDGANKVLRQMLYESHRLDSLTDAGNRQDAAFQQSMLEAIWEVTDAVQASNGQQELLIQNVNLLTLILLNQLEPPSPH
ncbi:uncharacterized protein LOC144108656 [Amblyomma americanum]